MNQNIIEEAYSLLLQKVQVAIACYMIKRCSQTDDILGYVKDFQNKYRMISEKCSISLERKIFLQQMLLLLPKFKDAQLKPEALPRPMEIDVEGEIVSIYVDFSLKLIMVTELLDALHLLLTLLKFKSISSEDIFGVYLKFGDLELQFHSYNRFSTIKIPVNAIKQSLRNINLKKIVKECMIQVSKLFKMYLNDLPQQQSLSSEEALVWMKKANVVMMKCIDTFAYEGRYQDMIVNLLHESIELTFAHQPKNFHYELYRYHVIRKWRYHKLLCTNAINIFIHYLEDVKKKLDDFDKKKLLLILKFTKLFLKTYCEIHFRKNNLIPSEGMPRIMYKNSSNLNKNDVYSSKEKCLETWARSLGRFMTKCRLSILTSLASSCFKIILSTGELNYCIEEPHH